VSPNSKNSLESLFDKEGMDKEVQQNAAGVWGVPRSLFSSPKSGGSRGLKTGFRDNLFVPDR
jgi:arginine/lysine/ornithine decarboxylase